MSDLLVRGGRTATGDAVDVAIVDGVVVADSAPGATTLDATGLVVVPGLIDLQVNGAAGIDLTLEPHRLWELAALLPEYGVTAFLPTVITSSPEARETALATYRAGPPPGWAGAVPLGVHLEGPMIAPARKGAHPERWLRDPSAELVAGWSREAGVAMVTLAPELPGALDVVERLVGRGVLVSVGHTAAPADQVTAATDRGVRLVTHLGNAMPPIGAREPGAAGTALADRRLVAGVIADGHHLHPATLAVFWRALGPTRFLSVTDCTAALGLPDGPARLGDQHVEVRDGAVRLDDGTLAGSAASLSQCLRVLRETTGCTQAEAVTTCTATAAGLMGEDQRGRIEAGARGDLTLLDDRLDVVATVVGGRVLHRRS
ncbi:N-acetylglucosamine-6-phosphate deacetylase [Nocardioides panacisoli]|uniref:N-acetylglucosamine-6-phosphate deacetylase n=1 Tax=Nocardioides panacisoli TaxID=627624 RepID=A0ABP7HVX5_9ACTN